MPHDVSLIALLAAGFGLAMVFGYLASLLRMSPLALPADDCAVVRLRSTVTPALLSL